MASTKVENGDRDRSPLRKDDDRLPPSDKGGRDRDRERDRERRMRPGTGGGGRRDRGRAADCRVYVSNIPYEYKWQELKDLFRRQIGDVTYVELFNDENNRPRGCGIVEFASPNLAREAVEKVHRLELNGRKLVVKEDREVERDQFGHIIRGARRDDDRRDMRGPPMGGDRRGVGSPVRGPGPMDLPPQGFNTYGLSPQFLENLGIRGPLTNKVFVANLDFKVDERKLEEVFKLAGRIRDVDLARDKDKKSRGWAVIEFDHPVEAVQAISMFNNQELYSRKMSVRLDEKDASDKPSKLPEGLKGIGMGLNPAAPAPAQDFGRMGPGPMGMGMGPGAPGPAAGAAPLAALGGLQGVLSLLGNLTGGAPGGADLSALTALTGLGGNLGLGGAGGAIGGPGPGMGRDHGMSGGMGGSGPSAGGISGLGGIGSSLGGMGGGSSGGSGYGGPSSQYGSSGGSQNSGPVGGYTPSPSSAIRERMYGERREMFGDRPLDRSMDRGSDMGRPVSGGGGFDSFTGGSLMSSVPGPVPPPSAPSSGLFGSQASRGMPRSSDTVKVSSLPSHVTWQMLRDKFSEIGEVRFAEVRGRGEGIVRFVTERDAQRAVDVMDRTRYEGRLIDVAFY